MKSSVSDNVRFSLSVSDWSCNSLCGLFSFFILRALGELVLHRPSSGSFVSYAREFLGEKITFVSNDDIEKSFKKLKVKALKDAMKNYIKELKFYSNNDFAFLEVHNKELFLKNALVLREVVELFAPYKLTQNSTNQFLGNLFELFLQKGMKQDEGQFFTPIQICEFIICSLPLDTLLQERQKPLRVIDYACGAGHFLNT